MEFKGKVVATFKTEQSKFARIHLDSIPKKTAAFRFIDVFRNDLNLGDGVIVTICKTVPQELPLAVAAE